MLAAQRPLPLVIVDSAIDDVTDLVDLACEAAESTAREVAASIARMEVLDAAIQRA